MGTETQSQLFYEYIADVVVVKLNNPQMGTETTSPMLQPFQTHQAAQLNLLIPNRGRKLLF